MALNCRKVKSNVLIYLILVVGLSGCKDCCEIYIPQKWHLGNMEAEFITGKPVLQVGDTILFLARIERYLYDLDQNRMDIDMGIELFLKISTTMNPADTTPGDTTPTDFFTIDTTIINVFDSYFDVQMIAGSKINAYRYNCQLVDSLWTAEILYIPRKAGSYWARISLQRIFTSDAELGDGVCMSGDEVTFGARMDWKPSEHNQIHYLFQDDGSKYPEYFGFIVEE